MKFVRFLAMLLMVVGSLNWGLIGFFGYNFVADIFGGAATQGARIVFDLVGLAGLYGIKLLCCGSCKCNCGPNCNCCKK